MNRFSSVLALLPVSLLLSACNPTTAPATPEAAPSAAPAAPAAPTLEGVWKRVEVDVDSGPNKGLHTADVQPGLSIFTKTHYSIVYVSAYAPRPVLGDKPTDAAKAAAFDGFVGNAGTYTLKDGKLTLTITAAKNPNGMTGQPGTPLDVEWAGDDVYFTTTSTEGVKTKVRLTRVAD